MTHLLIRYRVHPGELERHLELLHAVHAELAETNPRGMRWESFRLEDGVSFVDLVTVDAPGRFSRLRSWSPFRATLDERCEEPPTMTDLHPIAAFAPS